MVKALSISRRRACGWSYGGALPKKTANSLPNCLPSMYCLLLPNSLANYLLFSRIGGWPLRPQAARPLVRPDGAVHGRSDVCLSMRLMRSRVRLCPARTHDVHGRAPLCPDAHFRTGTRFREVEMLASQNLALPSNPLKKPYL